MEALGAAASVVGIISLGIQISQILQKQLDDVVNADERLVQIVYEIRATSIELSNLYDLLLEDKKNPDDCIFSEAGSEEILFVIRRCNAVFRNIVVLVARSGKAVLAVVDDFQRKVEKRQPPPIGKGTEDVPLAIQLSSIEHLMWPWRLPKIEQYIADLGRLKMSLLLLLAVAELAKKRRIKDNDAEESDDDTLLVDEVYYCEKGVEEAERKYCETTAPLSFNQSFTITKSSEDAAYNLVQNWPYIDDALTLPSISDIRELGVVIAAYVYELLPGCDFGQFTRIPISLRAIQEQCLSQLGPRKQRENIFRKYASLPVAHQRAITNTMYEIDSSISYDDRVRYHFPTLLDIQVRGTRRTRVASRLKSLTPFYGPPSRRTCYHLVVALAPISNSHEGSRFSPSAQGPFRGPWDPSPPPKYPSPTTYYPDRTNSNEATYTGFSAPLERRATRDNGRQRNDDLRVIRRETRRSVDRDRRQATSNQSRSGSHPMLLSNDSEIDLYDSVPTTVDIHDGTVVIRPSTHSRPAFDEANRVSQARARRRDTGLDVVGSRHDDLPAELSDEYALSRRREFQLSGSPRQSYTYDEPIRRPRRSSSEIQQMLQIEQRLATQLRHQRSYERVRSSSQPIGSQAYPERLSRRVTFEDAYSSMTPEDNLPPSQLEKCSVAEDLLRRWTTAFTSARDRLRQRMRSHPGSRTIRPSQPMVFRPRPQTQTQQAGGDEASRPTVNPPVRRPSTPDSAISKEAENTDIDNFENFEDEDARDAHSLPRNRRGHLRTNSQAAARSGRHANSRLSDQTTLHRQPSSEDLRGDGQSTQSRL